MSSVFGTNVRLSIFGQSHSQAIGCVVDGLPAGEHVDLGELARFMARRAPGRNAWSTPRTEADVPAVLGGLNDRGNTCGAPLALMIENTNTRSSDYSELRTHPRPGHADYVAHVKYAGEQDYAGGGHFSGRLTAPLCAAGGVALQILSRRGITIGAHVARLAGVDDARFDTVRPEPADLLAPGLREFPVIDEAAGELMRAAIEDARAQGDSVGGVIECVALGVSAGLGDPMFDGLENRLAQVLFGIPAVKGVEFGAGFASADLMGSQNNDPMRFEDGVVTCESNNAGGINGGISNGMPVVVRVAIKPTASIGTEQKTVDLERGADDVVTVRGRHDPCIVPRAVPVVEAACALALLDALVASEGQRLGS